jgi:hypothetical protein
MLNMGDKRRLQKTISNRKEKKTRFSRAVAGYKPPDEINKKFWEELIAYFPLI